MRMSMGMKEMAFHMGIQYAMELIMLRCLMRGYI